MNSAELEYRELIGGLLKLIRENAARSREERQLSEKQTQILLAAYHTLKQEHAARQTTLKQVRSIARNIQKACLLNNRMIQGLLELCEAASELVHNVQLTLGPRSELSQQACQYFQKNLIKHGVDLPLPQVKEHFLKAFQQAGATVLQQLEQVQQLINQMMIKMQLHDLATQELDAASQLAKLAAPGTAQTTGNNKNTNPKSPEPCLGDDGADQQNLADQLFSQHQGKSNALP